MRNLSPLAFSIALSLLAAVPVTAQFNASLQGTVKDKTGTAIPGAHVKIVNESTQFTREATANTDGLYRVNQIPPGTYSVSADAQGFKATTLNDLLVSPDLPRTADITLELGTVQETITVSAASLPLLQTTGANTGAALNARDLVNLPAFGRDPYQLARLSPGITGTGARGGSAGGPAALGNTTGPGGSQQGIFATENQVQISAAGQRVTSNVYQLDGVSVNSLQWGGAAVLTPNSESVAEINIVSTSYDAGDGRNSGAHTKITSKSGSNEFHGSGFFRFQDPGLNAYNKYGGLNGAPPTRVNTKFRQYGGGIGGPIKKDKLFFFVSYEGLSNKSTTFGTTWQETPQYRNLLLQQRPNSRLAQILGGATAAPRIAAVLNGTCANLGSFGTAANCRQLPGGLDVGSFAPGVAPGNPYVADGPTVGNGLDGIPDLQFIQFYNPTHIVGNQYNARIDYNITPNDLLAGSVYVTKLNRVSGDDGTGARPDSDTWFKPLSETATLIYIRNFSSNIVNELRSNFTRYHQDGPSDNAGRNWGIPTVQVEGYPAINRVTAGGPTRSETTPAILAQNTYETRDTLTTIFGNHTVHYGVQLQWEQNNNNLLGGARPLYSFRGMWNWANDAPVFEAINEDPTTGQVATGQRYYRTKDFAGFIEDEWNIMPGLRLNLGLRWEYFSPVTEARNRLTNIVLGANGPRPVIDSKLVGVNRLYDPNYKNFMPKVAIAYSPAAWHDRLVLRAGFGTTYNRQNTVLFSNGAGNPPYFARFNICCGQATGTSPGGSPFAGNQIQYTFGANNSPASYPPNTVIATGIDPRTGGLAGVNGQPGTPVEAWGAPRHLPDPYAIQYSFEAQAQVAPDTTLTLGYQATGGRHLVRLLNQNFLYASSVPGTSIQAPFFAIYEPTPDTSSSYNAFNARISRRFAKGFQLDGTYTWSKSIDYLSAEGPGAQTNQTNPANLNTERGPSDFDARHRFTLNGLWDLPIFPKRKGILGGLLGGWELGGILTAYSGFPWTPVTGSLQSVAPVTGAATISPTRPTAYFGNAGQDTSNSAFINGSNFGGANPNVNIVGTNYFNISRPGGPGIGRNSFRGPHYFSVDTSASKRFTLPFLNERTAIEIRANAYNVFNNLNLSPFTFGADDTKVENPNFGRSASAFAGRVLELQARFSF
jgi:hypothetical protein